MGNSKAKMTLEEFRRYARKVISEAFDEILSSEDDEEEGEGVEDLEEMSGAGAGAAAGVAGGLPPKDKVYDEEG